MTPAQGGTGSGLRVVVVGATGNVGTSVVEALGQDPAVGTIVGVSRRPPRWRAPKTEWAEADIVSADLVEIFDGADVVVHLAWLFQPTHRPLTTWRVNAVGGRRVFAAAARAGVPALVYASSVGAYSPGPKDRPVDENWPTDGWPIAGYTREKAYLERVLDAFEQRNPQMRVVRLRPGFIFKRESASQQRRLFTGPLLPGRLVRPGTVPVLPDLPGLRFQALHSTDAAEAYRLAVLRDVRGAFNVAAEPVVDGRLLAEVLRARRVRLPVGPVRAALALAWHLHLVPASPHLFDAVLRVPIMDTTRARTELGWTPRHTAREAIEEFLHGLRDAGGMPTAPLTPRLRGGRFAEAATGVGERP
ncbi:NAD-dependent epimerase/dehydratase family protein [Micromonospora sp. WMMD1102]|uniref:NAD-dependent epimerase/dehydratase family protein n=1 Tax=Micromonospora sp. WMMD1102 TaxID=3016105 RepID=UPI0024158B4E|nr:NAD-dependent epimerase/dehydratase family protein [Micromonospora sp. WMMD1102]MDG4786928.1 NAD-dependent epimerase/dehydratase family protein [Micromonospora sp. WMMD1102]